MPFTTTSRRLFFTNRFHMASLACVGSNVFGIPNCVKHGLPLLQTLYTGSKDWFRDPGTAGCVTLRLTLRIYFSYVLATNRQPWHFVFHEPDNHHAPVARDDPARRTRAGRTHAGSRSRNPARHLPYTGEAGVAGTGTRRAAGEIWTTRICGTRIRSGRESRGASIKSVARRLRGTATGCTRDPGILARRLARHAAGRRRTLRHSHAS